MTLPDGWRHEHAREIDSTNAWALRRAGAGERDRLWLSTDVQTAGRGRRGRSWVSSEGNLHASVLLRDPAPMDAAGSLALACGVAVHEAVAEARGTTAGLGLKWPNDLLLDGAKVAGLLIEARTEPSGTAVVAGFGVNCLSAPTATPYPAAALADVAPAELLPLLARAFDAELALWDRGRNVAAARERWLSRAGGVGEPIVVRLPHREIRGTFEALDERGHLLLRAASGAITPIAAGDVFPAAHPMEEHQ